MLDKAGCDYIKRVICNRKYRLAIYEESFKDTSSWESASFMGKWDVGIPGTCREPYQIILKKTHHTIFLSATLTTPSPSAVAPAAFSIVLLQLVCLTLTTAAAGRTPP